MAATTDTNAKTDKAKKPERSETSGRVVRVTGPVVDVEFPRGSIPELFNALHAEIDFESLAKTLTLEVAQHLGDNLVRTISLQPTDGLVRGVEVTDTGKPISVPVGEAVRATSSTRWGTVWTSPATEQTSSTGRFTASRRLSRTWSPGPKCLRPV
ncbi:hypothetical protein NIIDMKKI_18430 [Mycobacterium kansasii]|uniref:ATPase F1/V1/A1 complex alpha/beta subunit N-terminal domain-containing protein n=1 Tax=Mycobacterium kansasii TaxID=1768 RepID=A0A7G1I6P1_MYCKA|nr:hypothetical protein NIIDMKKI_18430 [Mycobacterium kansasii]